MTERTPAKDLGAVFDAHVKAEFVDMDVAASAFDPKRTNRDVCYLSAFGAKRTLNRAAHSKRIYEYAP